MKYTLMFSALAVVMAATPVKAQPVAADLLPAYEVATIVSSMGLRPVGRPAWMRGRYVVAAIDRYGREVNVVLGCARRAGARGATAGPWRLRSAAARLWAPGPIRSDGRSRAASGLRSRCVRLWMTTNSSTTISSKARCRRGRRRASPCRHASRRVTGRVTRNAPAARRDGAPTPRPRPSLAKVNDAGAVSAKPADAPAAAVDPAGKPPEVAKDAAKPVAAKDAAKPEAAWSRNRTPPKLVRQSPRRPSPTQQAVAAPRGPPSLNRESLRSGKEAAAKKPVTAERDIRVIDLSKPKASAQPADKPGEAIRF